MKTAVRWLSLAVGYLICTLAVLWAAGALYFDLPLPGFLRAAIALIWLAGVAIAWKVVRPRCYTRVGLAIGLAAIFIWWSLQSPRQDREWKPEVAKLSHAVVNGDTLTIYDVRNNEYRSATDYTPRYETRTYDLKTLQGVDLIISKWKWSSGILGHPMLSFDFGNGNHLVFSIEIRPEKDEKFATLPALYRQFEIIYIPADERDVVGARAAFRPEEEVYLYRITAPPDLIRETLLNYVARLNQLYERPEWYNIISANCTTSIRTQQAVDRRLPWDPRFLINGLVDKMLYDRGSLDTSKPFAELERAAYLNERAGTAYSDSSRNFSEAIRAQK